MVVGKMMDGIICRTIHQALPTHLLDLRRVEAAVDGAVELLGGGQDDPRDVEVQAQPHGV